jgi:serine/threonine protein kinase
MCSNPQPPFSAPRSLDPKAHILIDRNNRALLAGFGLISMSSDQETFLSSCVEGHTIRWMSPELLNPEKFGLKGSPPTKESDCYMLGMAIYEVLSGQTPFASLTSPAIIRKILDGERPTRPQGNNGNLFTDGIWRVVQRCLELQPRDRISASTILLGLEGNPIPLRPSSNADGDAEIDSDDQSDGAASGSSMFSPFDPRFIFNYHHGVSGLPIPRGGDGLPAPPLSPPPSARTRPMIPQDGAPLQDQPQSGIAKGGRIGDRLARSTREMFKAATRKFFGP